MRGRTVVPGLAGLLGLLLATAGCSSRAAQRAEGRRQSVPVEVGLASRQDVPVQLTAIGNGEPYLTVAVRARVSGQITKVYFKQGADVRQGDLLFLIDPRPFQDQVDQAEATLQRDVAAERQAEAALVRDRATAANAGADAARYKELFEQGIASRQQFDQFETGAQAAAATAKASDENVAVAREAVRLDRVRLADARLQLSYTEIRAPITGRTGNLNVQAGNMVKDQDNTPLVVINQVSPIYVTFAVPESALPEIRRQSQADALRVSAVPPGSTIPTEPGVLDFIDNTVDTGTGTIRLKGLFRNTDLRLWPGQFLNVTLDLRVDRDAVVVPSAAVQTGQDGKYVFVVDGGMTARLRPVVTGPVHGGNTVIVKGVAPGDRVITDGQLGVVDGSRVQLAGRNLGAQRAPAL